MVVFTSSPFNLVQGSQISIVISSTNMFGTSVTTTNVYGGLIAVVPSAPVLQNNLVLTSSVSIAL